MQNGIYPDNEEQKNIQCEAKLVFVLADYLKSRNYDEIYGID